MMVGSHKSNGIIDLASCEDSSSVSPSRVFSENEKTKQNANEITLVGFGIETVIPVERVGDYDTHMDDGGGCQHRFSVVTELTQAPPLAIVSEAVIRSTALLASLPLLLHFFST